MLGFIKSASFFRISKEFFSSSDFLVKTKIKIIVATINNIITKDTIIVILCFEKQFIFGPNNPSTPSNPPSILIILKNYFSLIYIFIVLIQR